MVAAQAFQQQIIGWIPRHPPLVLKKKSSRANSTCILTSGFRDNNKTCLFMADRAESSSSSSSSSCATSSEDTNDQDVSIVKIPDLNDIQKRMISADFDWNGFMNISLLIIVSVAALSKLATVDAGLMRGWTPAEMAMRIPIDNWNGYSAVLEDAPVSTKAITSATVYAIGDIVSQRTEGKEMGELDRLRIVRSLLAGLIGHGPLSHIWYDVSENLFDQVLHWTEWWSFLPKVALDQLTWGPFWNNCYILLLGIMKFDSLEKIWSEMKSTTVPLILSGLKLWVPVHCITYGLIPVENRLLWVDLMEIIWVTILASTAAAASQADPKTAAEPSSS